MTYENYGVTKRRVERNGKTVWCAYLRVGQDRCACFDSKLLKLLPTEKGSAFGNRVVFDASVNHAEFVDCIMTPIVRTVVHVCV